MNKDLQFELETLQGLFRQRSSDIDNGTPAERAAATPQLIALADKISGLLGRQHQLGVQTSEMLEKPTALKLMESIVRIITEELSALPDFSDWPRQFINLGADLENVGRLKRLIGETPGRYEVMENIAERIRQLPGELKNEPPKAD